MPTADYFQSMYDLDGEEAEFMAAKEEQAALLADYFAERNSQA